jgi:hypothetical protein
MFIFYEINSFLSDILHILFATHGFREIFNRYAETMAQTIHICSDLLRTLLQLPEMILKLYNACK